MIQKFTHRTVIVFLFILLSCWASRAATGIGVTLLTYTIDSGNIAGDGFVITINAQVTNFDSTVFNDTLRFGLRCDNQVVTTAGIFGQPQYSGDKIYLRGHESVPAVFSVHIEHQYFTPGPAVVVVWPICPYPIGDSIVINFTVADPTGIITEKDDAFSYVVLSNRILFKNLDAKTNFKQVRMYNILVQQVCELQSGAITEIPLPVMTKGIYFCELLTTDNSRKVIKFLH